MDIHAHCQELISRLLDQDKMLSEEENRTLQAHLAECEECRLMYDAFSALSGFVGGEMEEPPAELRENVMAEIRREEIRRRNRRAFRWTGFVAAAAVLLLVIGLTPRLLPRAADSAPAAAEMAAGALYAMPAEEAVDAPRAFEDNGASQYAAEEAYEEEYANDVEGTEIEDPNVTWEGDFVEYVPEGTETDTGLDPYFDDAEEEKLSMDSLLVCLGGVETTLDFQSAAMDPVFLIDTDMGVLQIFRYNRSLYFTDPYTGIPCEASCSEAALIRFLQE